MSCRSVRRTPRPLRPRRSWKPALEVLEDRSLLAPVNPLLFGLNQPWSDGDSWLDFDDDPDTTTRGEATRDAVARLGVQSLRYIGGTVSTFWDWQTADWVSDEELRTFGQTVYQGQAGRRDRFQAHGMGGPDGFYSPVAFAGFGTEAGFEPIWVPNLVTGEGDPKQIVAHAGDLFQHLADHGLTAQYVEMGNEFSLPEYAARIADSADYLTNRVHPVAARVRELYPDARIAASGLFAAPVWVHPSQYATELRASGPNWRRWTQVDW